MNVVFSSTGYQDTPDRIGYRLVLVDASMACRLSTGLAGGAVRGGRPQAGPCFSRPTGMMPMSI
jgi:hypothetical protein